MELLEPAGRIVALTCPECREPQMLECRVAGSRDHCTVTLISQGCACDPFHAWEDVWEQAREVVFEQGLYD